MTSSIFSGSQPVEARPRQNDDEEELTIESVDDDTAKIATTGGSADYQADEATNK